MVSREASPFQLWVQKRKAPDSEAFAICEPCSTGRSVFIVYTTEHVGLSIVGRASCFCERTLFVCGAVINLVPQTEEHVFRFARAKTVVNKNRDGNRLKTKLVTSVTDIPSFVASYVYQVQCLPL